MTRLVHLVEVGSVLRTLCIWSGELPVWSSAELSIAVTLLIIVAWTYLCTLVNFRGGPYAYALASEPLSEA